MPPLSKTVVRKKALELIRSNSKKQETQFYCDVKRCIEETKLSKIVAFDSFYIHGVRSINDLKAFAKQAQELVARGEIVKTGDIITLMKVDIIIRKAAIDAGISAVDGNYFKNNLGGVHGKSVLDRTQNYIKLLESDGEYEDFFGADFPLRNLKHVFDDVPNECIEKVLPQINAALTSWGSRRATGTDKSNGQGT